MLVNGVDKWFEYQIFIMGIVLGIVNVNNLNKQINTFPEGTLVVVLRNCSKVLRNCSKVPIELEVQRMENMLEEVGGNRMKIVEQ
jgi:hypothetical protein